MRKVIGAVLIIGFLVVDFLFFHDIFKSGEHITFAEYLTGALSVLVFIVVGKSFIED